MWIKITWSLVKSHAFLSGALVRKKLFADLFILSLCSV